MERKIIRQRGTRYIQTTSAPALRRVAEGCGEPMPSPLAAKPRLSTTDDDYDTAYVITVDSISELPEACGSYSYDFSYFYDDEATPPPTAQESSPATPDEPLGLPEDSATAAPAAESDGALGRRLARAAAACALAALLL